MKDGKINTNKLKISKFVYVIVFFLFVIFGASLAYRCLVDYKATDKLTISEFILNRNIEEDVLMPERGTIYDINGNILARDVSSYTVIAYLNTNRGEKDGIPRYVKDKENTAKILSEYIDTEYERILELLNKDAYQVEFGTGGKNLSQLEMEKIRDLNLPGIDFIKSTKRYYPNGDFASYLLGYTVNKEKDDGNTYMVGELGIEGYYNELLTGKSGYIRYEKDGRGNIIANSNEYREEATNGSDIYLTIDKNIQLFVENEVKKSQSASNAEWTVMGVIDAKTGAILGYSSTPSFDPNIRNLKNYMDPLVSYAYEPGSTMKTFSYMCAINSGKYNGSDTYESGSKTYVSALDKNDTVTIKDWNDGKGWGRISYDYGYAMSSNIAVANLLENVITKDELKTCYENYGFGKKTGINLPGELTGDIDFTYDVEAATAGYGQGIMITPIQMLQGLTIVANNGTLLKPYVVSKIVDTEGKIILKNEREELRNVATTATVKKIQELMRSVMSPTTTGGAYVIDGYDLIGKTGTGQIFERGKYLTGNGQYIYSFSGLYPGDDPEIIIYMAVKKPKDGNNYIASSIKEVVINTSKYLSIDKKNNNNDGIVLEDYRNNITTSIVDKLKSEGIRVVTLGSGNKIIDQYPNKNIKVYKDDLVVLLTNKYDNQMIDFNGFSYKEAKETLKLMNVDYELNGYGYVNKQSINPFDKIEDKVVLWFANPY